MKLKTLLKNVTVQSVVHYKNKPVSALYDKSNEVKKDGLFFCIRGLHTDGHAFAEQAVKNGAGVLVVEKKLPLRVTQVVVKNCRVAMSEIAKNFYHGSCDKVKIVSVVGTSGKTSITYILSAILTHAGIKNAIVGTTGTKVDGLVLATGLTTPDPIELHYLFEQLVQLGVEVVLLEASAQAIALHKLVGITSEIGIFTNLSNEHLDFFKTWEEYEQTKVSFFQSNVRFAFLNADSPTSLKIMAVCPAPVMTYGLSNPADTFAIDITTGFGGSSFVVNANDALLDIKTKLMGVFNVYNVLAAISAAKLLGVDGAHVVSALQTMPPIPGRMNVFSLDCNNKVIVDFAHSPDGFCEVLSLIRQLRKGHIITLFGCVGYSDAQKRTEMGKIAAQFSDEIILTTDNPLQTPFDDINADIMKGFDADYKNYRTVFDRRRAIELGFEKLHQNDTLVILGKGVEEVNKIGTQLIPHRDLQCVTECIEQFYRVRKNQTSAE